jgi:hypothetical protein
MRRLPVLKRAVAVTTVPLAFASRSQATALRRRALLHAEQAERPIGGPGRVKPSPSSSTRSSAISSSERNATTTCLAWSWRATLVRPAG